MNSQNQRPKIIPIVTYKKRTYCDFYRANGTGGKGVMYGAKIGHIFYPIS
jgi:hypothetical protein